ncbi:brain tumor protein [Episyrphus balteatus]|uniref:brain tumor protein n=1 Tax=Episyrphus balteatus TaxID=286459 RepID=UPI002486AAA3|nr:brain tumor protein [Episyrphus balteatus]XP_055856467.1 brain tumor protein [Episyrphus balteatus]XP_055856476.1 brain tumor protein [Episyrphus balteatus]
MATSPTPSLDSIRGTNSIESYGDHNGYMSDSPLTLSGSSPPVSDSAICDDYSGATSSIDSQHQTSSASSSASSTSSTSGLNCGGTVSGLSAIQSIDEIPNDKENGVQCNGIITRNLVSISFPNGSTVPRCTACKSKQSDAVAKCFECANFLCSNCVTAHEFMHCFNGHNVCLIENPSISNSLNSNSGLTNINEFKFGNSLSNIFQTQSNRTNSSLSKIINGVFENNTPVSSSSSSQSHCFNCKDELLTKLSSNNSISNRDDVNLLASQLIPSTSMTKSSQYFCNQHKNELLNYFCRTCSALACKDCVASEHSSALHEVEHSQEFLHKQPDCVIQGIVAELRGKVGEVVTVVSNSDLIVNQIKSQYQKAHSEVNETYQFFYSMLDERKQEILKELESLHNAKMLAINSCVNRSKEAVDKALQACDNIERTPVKPNTVKDVLALRKTVEYQYQSVVQDLQVPFELEFVSNYQSIQVGVRNTFGYIRATNESSTTKQPPIARPTPSNNTNQQSSMNALTINNSNNMGNSLGMNSNILDISFVNNSVSVAAQNALSHSSNNFDSNAVSSKRFNNNFQSSFSTDLNMQLNPYEKWSNGSSDTIFTGISEQYITSLGKSACSNLGNNSVLSVGNNNVGSPSSDSIMDLTSKLLSTTMYPPKSQIKRQKMIYHCKFGEFGVTEGQFTEPSGVAVNAQNDIIVADTNNHRIQIFDKEGRFKFQFGECGKRDGQLLYPNRVAVVKTSGDIIVTERSPTHQIQIYNQYGQFVRKFGANILQHPRGVTVDNKGRIIVVECKVMRVIIFDQNGNVIQKFGCSKHLEFPNGVIVNDKQEIFISDNRAHCVKVFNYEGQYLRQIGGEGVTNYPIGVGINSNGEILIADNHNNFNLTIFTQDGQLVSALESKVKHAQCFDVALMDDGSVVLASKDYRLYIYRYVQAAPIGL